MKKILYQIKKYWMVFVIAIISIAIWVFSSRHTARKYKIQQLIEENHRAKRELEESIRREEDRDAAYVRWAEEKVKIIEEHQEVLMAEEERLLEIQNDLENKNAHELVNTLSSIIQRQRNTGSGK
jgi:predicted RND superfamily exporter protein